MAGWKNYDGQFGNNAARFKDVVKGVTIEAGLYDADGDFVQWHVKENGKIIVSADVRCSGRTMAGEEMAWDLAKRRAELVICLGTDRIKQLAKEKANVSVAT